MTEEKLKVEKISKAKRIKIREKVREELAGQSTTWQPKIEPYRRGS
ncbi:hypothetical protein TUM4438_43950 [Shewanella sairae]|uniref:Uncharacterized protein n=1 Tax=Shewanella sairae TaxID=190310 RepID=A0ABQ4PRC0_9GAMM|nr:hypothetical protein [Shewanella sairae]MCL1132493.1 hypothetical protein [Shewanella sairae]GIU52112.1 hypothetical protein TUM4438_43950 [Shewanella sairae]